ncbi:hypothetical protein CJ030_MR6G026957 [Morella rubra]|uniref:Fe2OG dioxygenase domain-containing protein n=1 Tax=Morella rubra TaxID=262757 RepID=A0A6A1V7T6_9ROSI|nr:hypothetical protein CJ030_MR6G026957 [Morella rubra]
MALNAGITIPGNGIGYDRAKEVKEFEETKAGVKGLVDSGVAKVPRFMIHPPESRPKSSPATEQYQVPLIDLQGLESCQRVEIVCQIRKASETWGFFQMVNHGIPARVMDNMLEAVRRFHEQPKEEKMEWYSRDYKQPVRYYCNGDLLVSKAANWRDSILFDFQDGSIKPEAFPFVCREAVSEYMEYLTELSSKLSELLSEALGLSADYLARIECMKIESVVGHYYPPCPEPDLTLGTTKHSDPGCLTLLLQDNIGGLEVLHKNHWVGVPPVQGAIVANIGDFLQGYIELNETTYKQAYKHTDTVRIPEVLTLMVEESNTN